MDPKKEPVRLLSETGGCFDKTALFPEKGGRGVF